MLSPSELRNSLALQTLEAHHSSGVYFIMNTVTLKCYVGSSVKMLNRLRSHFSCLVHGTHHSHKLQRAVAKYGLAKFRWGVCEFAEPDDLEAIEQKWIDVVGDYNVCLEAGSPRGTKMVLSEPERLRRSQHCRAMQSSLSEAQKSAALEAARLSKVGVPLTDAHRLKLSEATKGRKLSEQHREKLAAINKTRKPTPDELLRRGEKIKAALAARSAADMEQWKQRLSNSTLGRTSPNKGKKATPESRARMSAAQTGKVITDAQRERISKSMLAKPKEWYEARAVRIREAKKKPG